MAEKIHHFGKGDYGPPHGVQEVYGFWCPGCERPHSYHVPRWNFNGSMDRPTFTPSLLLNKDVPEHRCHLWLTEGRIKFEQDCDHVLRGQTVDLPDWE